MVFPFALIDAVNVTGVPGQTVEGFGVIITIGLGCITTTAVLITVHPCGVTTVSVTLYVPGPG